MLATKWLAILGVVLELIGLTYLLREWLAAKDFETALYEFTKLQSDLESSVRDLTIRMNSGLTALADFIRSHLSILEMEAEYRENPKAFAMSATTDPGIRQVLDLLQGHSPRDLRKLAVEKFVFASAALPRSDQTARTLSLDKSVRAAIERNYADQVTRSRRLTSLARIGASFVAAGVGLQILDLLVS